MLRYLFFSAIILLTTAALAKGSLSFEPNAGVVGSRVEAVATGLEPGAALELVWSSAEAGWNVEDGRFMGITASETRTVLASGVADESGEASLAFSVPEDFGYVHNVFLESAGEQVARQGFTVVPQLSISPASGPAGTPITVTMTGVGYRFWESVWHLLYDGAHTGWLSAVTTKGTAKAVIPATGAPGPHTLQALSGTHPVPYLNQQQSPVFVSQVPTVQGAVFEITPGPAVMPPAASSQGLRRQPAGPAGVSGGPALHAEFASGAVGSPIGLTGSGFEPGEEVSLSWTTVRGNDIIAGLSEVSSPLATVKAGADGTFRVTVATPDDLGGAHAIRARGAGGQAEFTYVVTPSVVDVSPKQVAPGGDITVTIKGVGWTDTANIYTLVMDNGYLGYGCGVNSQGDVTIHLKAPGQPGMHYISLYPSIYRGVATGPGAPPPPRIEPGDEGKLLPGANATFLQIPMLNPADHPGEELPAFQLAFEVLGLP